MVEEWLKKGIRYDWQDWWFKTRFMMHNKDDYFTFYTNLKNDNGIFKKFLLIAVRLKHTPTPIPQRIFKLYRPITDITHKVRCCLAPDRERCFLVTGRRRSLANAFWRRQRSSERRTCFGNYFITNRVPPRSFYLTYKNSLI